MTATAGKHTAKANYTRGIARWSLQMTAMLVIYGAALFLAAGRLDWTVGWAYLGVNFLVQVLSAVVLIPRRPDMLAERSKVREGTKRWDRVLAPAISLAGPLAFMITGGLDARFSWTGERVSSGLWIAGLALMLACSLFVIWAMASNPFFAATVRIQGDRGHRVVRGGPYRFVRHPGYLGALVFDLVAPLALRSLWAFLPALLTVALIVYRTALEDRTLQAELPGYADYAKETRSRLVPGVW